MNLRSSFVIPLLLWLIGAQAQSYYHQEIKSYATELYQSFSKTQKFTAL